uniref:EF-hand domain-containing protein n=1 Tax=Rhodosorus marinus TaxID=101924 RepID=A0A7S2ZN08_9RHOD|mmetsp:Transcript_25541/g.100874  ORF Transcript_25541/g.100874 Transcript_25541/m.100874 type:complete len:206 (+) Transcript_25541:182-799(+)
MQGGSNNHGYGGYPPPGGAPGGPGYPPPPQHAGYPQQGGPQPDSEREKFYQWFGPHPQDAAGLSKVVQKLGLTLPVSVCGLLLRMHDFDRTGTINFNEFMSVHQFILSVRNSFVSVDTDGNGVLTLPELQQALGINGFSLDNTALGTLMESFDPERKGHLDLPAFVGLAAFLSSARGLFNQMDLQKQGQITVNFNQFCWLVGHLR